MLRTKVLAKKWRTIRTGNKISICELAVKKLETDRINRQFELRCIILEDRRKAATSVCMVLVTLLSKNRPLRTRVLPD